MASRMSRLPAAGRRRPRPRTRTRRPGRSVKELHRLSGLIDLHTHVYWGGTSLGIDAEEFCRLSGVTTAIDTGSAGPGNFAGFRKHVIERSEVRILAYLHISFAGIFGFSKTVMVGESENIKLMAPRDAVRVADENRDVIISIKVRRYTRIRPAGAAPLNIAPGGRWSYAAHVPHRPSAAFGR